MADDKHKDENVAGQGPVDKKRGFGNYFVCFVERFFCFVESAGQQQMDSPGEMVGGLKENCWIYGAVRWEQLQVFIRIPQVRNWNDAVQWTPCRR